MTRPAPKSFHIKSFGCQMNVYDGERMAELLGGEGMVAAESEGDGRCRGAQHLPYPREGGGAPRLFGYRRGCGAMTGRGRSSRWQAASRRPKAPRFRAARASVDIVVGPQAYHRLPELVSHAARGAASRRSILDHAAGWRNSTRIAQTPRLQRPSAFLTVQEGCDKFCTYCVVPYTRGGEVSAGVSTRSSTRRSALIDGGAKEITLLGQNVNAWSDGDLDLADLDPSRSTGCRGCIASAIRPATPTT